MVEYSELDRNFAPSASCVGVIQNNVRVWSHRGGGGGVSMGLSQKFLPKKARSWA